MEQKDIVLDVRKLNTSFVSDGQTIRIVKDVSFQLKRGKMDIPRPRDFKVRTSERYFELKNQIILFRIGTAALLLIGSAALPLEKPFYIEIGRAHV